MALVRWAPFREIDAFEREMNRLFNTLVPTGGTTGNGYSFMPAAEIHETPEAIALKLEVPGIDAKDLNVEVTADSVSISGERRSENQTDDNGVFRSEFRYGKFQRVIPLPAQVKNDQVQAEYKDGVLNLTLPKAEAERNKVVKVNLA